MRRGLWRSFSCRGVPEIKKAAEAAILFLSLAALLTGCGGRDTALTEAERKAIEDISGIEARAFQDMTSEIMAKGRQGKFPAVSKVYRHGDVFAFIAKPVAYNGPVTLALVIDGGTGESAGMRIVEHKETPHYVRDMESDWFVARFAHKSARAYLRAARLTARDERDVVAITGATVTTEGVVNGVNAAFGVYQEYFLGEIAADVPYMVRFEPGAGDGPIESGSLVFRAYGLVLAEVSLEEIRMLPSVKRTMSIHSTTGETRHAFRGTLLSNVMDLADPGWKGAYSWVLAVGVDEYMSGISMEEVMAENSVYVMYEDNGEPLPMQNGEPGAMRIVVLDDFFGQRFTNYLLEIVLENECTFP